MSDEQSHSHTLDHVRRFAARIAVFALAVCTIVSVPAAAQEISPERIIHSGKEPQNWLTFYGNYRAWSYSSLNQITRENVRRLLPAWTFPTGGHGGLESAPIV